MKEDLERLNELRSTDMEVYKREGEWNPKKGIYTSPSGAVFEFPKLTTYYGMKELHGK